MKKLLLIGLVLLFVRCTEKVAGTTDETITGTQAKAMVAGKLFEPDGKTPAKAATVSMRKKSMLADTSHAASNPQPFTSASVTTDRNGTFAIDTIDTGTYIIEGTDGANNVVLIDSIKVKTPDSTKNLGADTLLPAGVVKGVIKLTEGGDPRKVFVLAFGLDRFALPDSGGNFTFPMLAKGTYALRFLPSLENYGVLDTSGVGVKSADTTNLDTIVLPFKGIPSPKNLVVSYDTLRQRVILSWGQADTSLITGYNIYRSDNKQNFNRISQMPVPKTITVYYDSNVIVGGVYEYRVVSLNASGNESSMGGTPGDTIKIISSSQVTTIMTWAIKNTISDTASINDTIKFILNFQNPTRKMNQVRWFVNRKDSVIRQSVDSSLTGKDSLSYFWNKAEEYKVYVNVIDAGGTVWADSDSVCIIQDVPQVKIVGDSAVAINTPITFLTSVTQKFGTIVKYQWDNGITPGTYINGDSVYTVKYLKEGRYTISVLVTDDDGNINSNTKTITITNDAPTIAGLKDTTISIKDTVLFSVSAHDTNGILQKYYWNFGDGSAKQFDTTKVPTDSHMFPSIAMQCTISVSVADSFGKLSARKAVVHVLQDVPVPNAGKDTTVSIKDTIRLHGSATQQFGTITEWAWDIGNTGTFKVTSKGDTIIIAPATENLNYLCILRVTDDDGNVAKDTVKVIVMQDVPIANAGSDQTILTTDTIRLHGSATQQFGIIAKWEWDVGGTGAFISTSKSDTSFVKPAIEDSNFICILRVTDDDGNVSGPDTVKIRRLTHLVKWETEIPSAGYLSNPAIGTDGTIYVGSADYNLYAVNSNGTVKWQFSTGGFIRSSPAIGIDGTIYVGSADYNLYAINPDGTIKWQFTTGDAIESSPAIGANGTIYVGSNDYNLYAINPDGTKKWEFVTEAGVNSSPVVGIDGTIYVLCYNFNLYAVNPDGTKKWEISSGANFAYSSIAIGADGTIYTGSGGNSLYAINPDGTMKWEFITQGNIWTSPAIGVDGTIYVGCEDRRFYAINSNGTKKWDFPMGSGFYSSPAISMDGTIYVGNLKNKLYAMNPDGTEKWEFLTSIGSQFYTSPTVSADGTVYVINYDGNLYAIATTGKGLASSPWPMFHHDAKHTGRAQ
jgi:outer membrane protein assembly factor BamB